jgi:zinc protease
VCLLRGTRRRSSEEINEFTDRYGMSLTPSVRPDGAGVSITSLTEDTEKALELLGEVLMEPAFAGSEVERLKGETLVAVRQSEKDTRAMAEKTFAEAVYPEGHPYRGFSLGSDASVKSFTGQDLETFHRTFYDPGHTIVATVSSQEPEEMFSVLERVFGGWTAAPEAGAARRIRERRESPVAPPRGEVRSHVFIPGKTQCDIALGFPSISRGDPDYYRFTVMDMVIGQLGLGGRVGHNVWDRQGLAYYVYSGLRESKGQGAWAVRAGVNPRSVGRAVSSILEEIRSLQSAPCTAQELADVKGFMTGYLPLSLETSRALAANMLNMEYFGLGLDYLQQFSSRVSAVTRTDVQEMARRHLSADDYVLVVTGPEPGK